MSNAVYPELPGLDFGVTRAPRWKTQVKTTPSDREYRATDIVSPRYAYGLKYEFLRSRQALQELQTLIGFFNSRRGSLENFLFRDPDDFQASAQQFALGDGVTNSWQLVRSFGGFVEAPDYLADMPRVRVGGVLCNLLQANQNPANTDWWTGAAVITSDTNQNIFGDTLADRIEDTSTTQTNEVRQDIPVISDAGPYLAQVYVFKTSGGTSKTLQVVFRLSGGLTEVSAQAKVNTDTGALLGDSDSACEVFDYSATYWRVRIRLSNNGTGNSTASLIIRPAIAAHGQSVIDVTQTGAKVFSTMGVYKLDAPDESLTWSILTASFTPTGVVTIRNGPPGSGEPLTWSGTYLRRVRFMDDTLTPEKFADKFWKLGRVDLISVKGES